MNHFHTFKTEQVGQVPENTIHISISSQSDTLQVKSPHSCKIPQILVYIGYS